MPVANDGVEPTRGELRTRFGCGALVGAVAAVAILLSVSQPSWLSCAGVGLLGGLVAGFLAYHFGDRFWLALRNWLPWP